MQQRDQSNELFTLATDLVNDTSQHLFLTGKAGTGKTTFLKYILEHAKKNTVVVAPTGVAAINAGGVTMHSFFQLPRGMFLPGSLQREGVIGYADITDKHSLFKNIHFNANKRQLLQELELLVIDEVSMVRCDMLDAIDTILRHFRKAPHLPFGGVQVVYIGDLFQLPPVVGNEEWELLKNYYQTPFFFSAQVVAEAQPHYIELKKIYRQSEQQFIEVLNRVRNNALRREDLDFLNARYQPDFQPAGDTPYITLTTHNRKADAINAAELQRLPGKLHTFEATVKDEFSDKAMPTDFVLQLKEGAQVMFIKNDTGGERRYFNGRLATIKKIASDEITVSFDDDSDDLKIEKETWKNIRYIYNKENDEIDEEELGSFTQYPIRLAWAITVHKSQGLTFDRAVIDAGASFAPGQVYVALSRCTNMEGMVLRSRIYPSSVSTDKRIIEFAQREADLPTLRQLLEEEKYRHWGNGLLRAFDWSKILMGLYEWMMHVPDAKLPKNADALPLARSLVSKARELSTVAEKFRVQLEKVLAHTLATKDTTLLQQRMEKAIGFFAQELAQNILGPLQEHARSLEHASKIKKYKDELKELQGLLWQQLQKMMTASYGHLSFAPDPDAYLLYDPGIQKSVPKARPGKLIKKSTAEETLALFRTGKSIEEIAALRNLAASTIHGHLAAMIHTGQVDVAELVTPEKIGHILKAIETVGVESIGAIKARLGDDYSFGDIRAVMNYHRFMQKQEA